jgi:transcriptional regulator GlxA family with amidase domain
MKTICSLILFITTFNLTAQNNIVMPINYRCPECNNECDKLVFEKSGTCPHCGMKLIVKDQYQEMPSRSKKKISVCLYLQDNVEVLDFAGPMEVFALAGFKVFTVSKTKEPVFAQRILKVFPDYDIKSAPDADMVVFFGGNPAAFRDSELIDWIKTYSANCRYIFSVCSGSFALGHAGLLKGMTATTFHARIEEMRDAFPDVTVLSDVRFVDNGRIITTAGISAGIDGALHMVARISGAKAASEVAREMEYDKWIPNEGLINHVGKD